MLTALSFWNQELEKEWYWLFQHLSTTCFTLAGLSFASVFAIFAFFHSSPVPPTVISLLLIAGALFALAGELAREAYFLWKFFAAEFIYIVGLLLFLASFLIFVNSQSVVLSDPILVSAFFLIVIAFFCWRIVHNIHVARRHVKSISTNQTSNQQPSPNKPSRTIYIELIVFAGVFGIVAAQVNISGPNMATMTNTFATVSGVLLGLFFVVKAREGERDPGVTQLLLFSILISLISSLFSFDPSYVQSGTSRIDFGIAATFFEASTVYFVIKTELLGPLSKKKGE